MKSLFEDDWNGTPLAEQLRPKTLDEVIGQQHLIGPGKPLALIVQAKQAHSFILWGPPGVGKTTLARIIATSVNAEFIQISAVLAGVKEIREAIQKAEHNKAMGKITIAFIDEIHRFNKTQQDAFLPHVESGLFTFIGATTENPSFEVNSALLSRATVYVLHPLGATDLKQIMALALDSQALPAMESGAIELLAEYADGDARRLLNTLETLAIAARQERLESLSAVWLQKVMGQRLRRFDAGADQFYDSISALHKSVRGSDPDAALYWLVRMLDGGADPRYLARRLIRMACEDIGLADPRALRLALDAAEVYERLGSPEGELALAECTLYLAVAAKSNAVYKALNAVRTLIKTDGSRAVPLHLRNAPTRLMKQLDYGKGYRYAHDEADAFAAGESYLPDGMASPGFYQPVERGLEIKIAEKMRNLKRRNDQAR